MGPDLELEQPHDTDRADDASSSLTTGNIVTIQNTAAAVTSTGKVLNISDATTGSGYGVYSSMTGHGNTGYAGYFINTDTSATTTNYGVYGYVRPSPAAPAAIQPASMAKATAGAAPASQASAQTMPV